MCIRDRYQGTQDAWGGPFGVTQGLYTKFGGERVRDTTIAEAGFFGAAIGAAMTGLRPIVELMYVDFAGVCFDQMMNQAAKVRYMFGGKQKVPMVVRTVVGAGFRAGSEHSQTLYSLYTHIPGLKVVAPYDAYDAKGLLLSSIKDDDPVIFMEHKRLYMTSCEVPDDLKPIPLGKGRIRREGSDVTIIAIQRMNLFAEEAANELEKINEKPEYEFLVNTGLYILNYELLDLIPKNQFYHITNLFEMIYFFTLPFLAFLSVALSIEGPPNFFFFRSDLPFLSLPFLSATFSFLAEAA